MNELGRHGASPVELQEQLIALRGGLPFLLYRDGEQHQRIIGLEGQHEITVGRDESADVALSWDNQVSRLHAKLECIAGQWIVVDDGPEPQPVAFQRDGWTLQVLRPEPAWKPGQNTQARNLLAGLAHCCSTDRVVVTEDDDHYAPDWLTTVDAMLEKAELVGECRARYYSLPLRSGRQLQNAGHASLCSTAVRGGAIDALRKACQSAPKFIDLQLWRRFPRRHLFGGHRVHGIKGLPGRGGIGMGHSPGFRGTPDPDGSLLRSWIGQDAGLYR